MKLIAYLKGGPISSSRSLLFGINNPKIVYDRKFYAKGYERVFNKFDEHMRNGVEAGAQCTVYVKGKLVVDLSANFVNNKLKQQEYNSDTLQTVFSSTKSVAAICLAMLIDRGLIESYDDKITKYWPEFGKNGKENILIKDLMRHEAGLHDISFKYEEIQKDQIKKNVVGKFLEDQEPFWFTKSTRAYHGQSRGFVINEILRRVDPKNRTLGEFLQEEISQPLGIDFYMKMIFQIHEEEKFPQTNFMTTHNMLWLLFQALLPQSIRKTDFSIGLFIRLIKVMQNKRPEGDNRKFVKKLDKFDFNDKMYRTAENPSANGETNAKSMAVIASVMAQGGKNDKIQLMSKETYEKMHDDPKLNIDTAMFGVTTQFTQGGVCLFDEKQILLRNLEGKPNEIIWGFHGWMGYGGSILQWHKDLQIGFGFACNSIHHDQQYNSFKIQKEVYECAKALN